MSPVWKPQNLHVTAKRKKPVVVLDQKTKNILLMEKISNGFLFVYILSVSYQRLRINGFDLGQYFRPIASISGLLVFFIVLAVQYVLQNMKENSVISSGKVFDDFVNTVSGIAQQKATRVFHYIWQSIKVVFINALIASLLLIPIGVIFAFIQGFLTGKFESFTTY
jgi:hypothetical protein